MGLNTLSSPSDNHWIIHRTKQVEAHAGSVELPVTLSVGSPRTIRSKKRPVLSVMRLPCRNGVPTLCPVRCVQHQPQRLCGARCSSTPFANLRSRFRRWHGPLELVHHCERDI